MRAFLGILASLGATWLSGCGTSVGVVIDRSSFTLGACPAGASSPFEGITPGSSVDYIELREDSTTAASRGAQCQNATDPKTCSERAQQANPFDAWSIRPSGGAPAPRAFLVATSGDTVTVVGKGALGSFLAPIENPYDAAFIAEAATEGTADCIHSVRAVAGGFEVLTETNYCSGGQAENRVFVSTDGTATIREHVVVSATPSDIPECP